MAFYQKYRPQKFSELIGEDHVANTLVQAVLTGKLSHAYLFCGPRGTGKTSTARLLAKAFNCLTIGEKQGTEAAVGEPCDKCASCREIITGRSVDVIEIDAASHTGVDDVRDLIEKSRLAPIVLKKKIYIIDEVHMLSKSAFNALLKTLEEPPNHVIFILATTDVQKLPATVLSRVQRYDFKRVLKADIVKNLRKIAKSENIKIDDESLELIALSAHGGHRDAVGLLEKVSTAGDDIKASDVRNILGIVSGESLMQFVGAIFNNDPEEGLKIAHQFFENGIDMGQFSKDVIEVLRKMLLFRATGKALFEDTKENIEAISKLSTQKSVQEILHYLESFLKAKNLLKDLAYPILPVETAIIESCSLEQDSIKSEILNPKSETNSKQEIQNVIKNVIPSPEGDPLVKIEESSNKISRQARDDKEICTSPDLSLERRGTNNETMKQSNNDKKADSTKEDIEPSTLNSLPSTVKTPVLQMTSDLWQKMISETKKENNSLAALLRDAKPLEISDNKLVLGVKFKFHKDKISENSNAKIIEKVFCDMTGNKCVVFCELIENKPKEAKAKEEDLSKAAEEIFS